jgi:hypothetical protein
MFLTVEQDCCSPVKPMSEREQALSPEQIPQFFAQAKRLRDECPSHATTTPLDHE